MLLALLWGHPGASAEWRLEKATGTIKRHTQAPAPNGLPDGHVAVAKIDGDIASAWYTKPTRIYGHGILGDAIEAGALTVQTSDGTNLTFSLPSNQVFEDRTPRLHDLDGFGRISIVTILTDVAQGASIAVFGLVEGKLELRAQTPYIGRSNRWRNIAGIEDFDGKGSSQIAEVVTPHIGGTLKFWTWSKGSLKLAGEATGFSNHFIGSREQGLSAIEDFDGDGVVDIAVPSANRMTLRLMKLDEGEVVELAKIPMPNRIDKPIAVSTSAGRPVLTVGLEDGSSYRLRR